MRKWDQKYEVLFKNDSTSRTHKSKNDKDLYSLDIRYIDCVINLSFVTYQTVDAGWIPFYWSRSLFHSITATQRWQLLMKYMMVLTTFNHTHTRLVSLCLAALYTWDTWTDHVFIALVSRTTSLLLIKFWKAVKYRWC